MYFQGHFTSANALVFEVAPDTVRFRDEPLESLIEMKVIFITGREPSLGVEGGVSRPLKHETKAFDAA